MLVQTSIMLSYNDLLFILLKRWSFVGYTVLYWWTFSTSCFSGILPCTILIPGLFFIPESPRWLVSSQHRFYLITVRLLGKMYNIPVSFVLNIQQAKMGMTEDFEASLQVLRGFDTDISIEVNEIKVKATHLTQKHWTVGKLSIKIIMFIYIV